MLTTRSGYAFLLTCLLSACGGSGGGGNGGGNSPTPTATATATATPTATPTPSATPTPHPDAIARFEAEDYTGFYDTTNSNLGGDYRSDAVDIDRLSGTDDSYYVGWWAPGEWLAFDDLIVPATGNYQIRARVASLFSARLARFEVDGSALRLGQIEIPDTGSWTNYEVVSVDTTLTEGTHTLRLFSLHDQWNIDWIEVIPGGEGGSPSSPLPQPPAQLNDPLELVWSDEFDEINTDIWSFETGGGGWGNFELQYYTNGDNAAIELDEQADSNVLVIEARKEDLGFGCWNGDCQYTSTRMISRFKQSFQYGRVEARIKLPRAQGIWPAFWMLGDNFNTEGWPQGGEIDIMEHVGTDNYSHGTVHGPGYSGADGIGGSVLLEADISSQYHVYAIEWDADGIRWFVDDNNFFTLTKEEVELQGDYVFDQPFWLLLNIAVGGNWPGNPASNFSTQRMYVDYVRVYQ